MFYDGLLLEDLIEGYTTLKVEGREMTSLTIDSTAVKVGAIVSNQKNKHSFYHCHIPA